MLRHTRRLYSGLQENQFLIQFYQTYYGKAEMSRGGDLPKKYPPKALTRRLLHFLDRNFDWVVLVFITLIILLVFVLF